MKDKKGNTLKVGDILIHEDYPNSIFTTFQVTNLTDTYIEIEFIYKTILKINKGTQKGLLESKLIKKL